MVKRTLMDIVHIDAVPKFGRCSQCGRSFYTSTVAMSNREKATRDFYARFEKHPCLDSRDQSPAGTSSPFSGQTFSPQPHEQPQPSASRTQKRQS
jgi:hypothetical protein